MKVQKQLVKLAFHDANTDILAMILADTSDTRDFLKLLSYSCGKLNDTPTYSRHDVGEDVGVGVVECGLIIARDLCDWLCRPVVGGRAGSWRGQRSRAGVADVDITIVVVVTQTPDDGPTCSVVDPSVYPVLGTVRVRPPRHARPERVVNATQVHFCT